MSGTQHYGTFDVRALWGRIRGMRREREILPLIVRLKIGTLEQDRENIEGLLGRPARGLKVLVVGPGQLFREARFFAMDNDVTCVDLDVMPRGFDVRAYAQMWRVNGPARVIKTLGRAVIGSERAELEQFRRQLGASEYDAPPCLVGNICDGAPEPGTWDVVASWSVLQTIPADGGALEAAVRECARALAPGGVCYHQVHQWTSHTGHHDLRAFTGREDEIPPWAHLREGLEDQVQPSATLNRYRVAQWQALFEKYCPGTSVMWRKAEASYYSQRMTPQIREELSDYSDEELLNVNALFGWRRPE